MTRTSDQVVAAAQYLETQGMSASDFARLHHFSLNGKSETFGSVIRYFGSVNELRETNTQFAERVCFVAAEHRRTGAGFATLVDQALDRWPLKKRA